MRLLAATALLCGALAGGCADLDLQKVEDFARAVRGDAPLDTATVDSGLREALRVGIERAVRLTSREGGFATEPAIRLAVPEELSGLANALRRVGLGGKVDELELLMNRAAERASGEAADVFRRAIAEMTLADVFSILEGEDTAATEFFRGRTEAALRSRFRPIVDEKMGELRLYREYTELVRLAETFHPTAEPFDLADRITDETLDGLFEMLGREERRIREDPVARTTELLRRVFGR